jgi:hypothetical protein
MGGRHSRPRPVLDNPSVDKTVFTDIGCIGLKSDDYTLNSDGSIADTNILSSAPFLWRRFTASSYKEIKANLTKIFKDIQPEIQIQVQALSDDSSTNIGIEGFRSNPHFNFKNLLLKRRQASQNLITRAALATGLKVPTIQYSGNGKVYGPVYLVIAQDPTAKKPLLFEGFVYFPSMNTNGKKYKNLIELSISHRWMQTLLYSRTFARKPVTLIAGSRPNTKCEMYNGNKLTGDPIKYGCRTNVNSGDANTATACKEKPDILKEQGTYKDGSGYHDEVDYGDDEVTSEKAYYPSVYFHTYQLNVSNPLFGPYMNSSGFSNLQLNGMTDGMEFYRGCQFMLISPNGRLLFILDKNSLNLKLNTSISDLVETCYMTPHFTDKLLTLKQYKFKGVGTRFVIEDNTLNVYATDVEGGIEDLAYSVQIVDPKAKVQSPYVMTLDNTGRLHVYNNADKDVTSPALISAFAYDGQPNPDGSENTTATNKGVASKTDGFNSQYDAEHCILGGNQPYDAAKAYRCRFLNLVAYMQLRGLLKTLIKEESHDNSREYQVMYAKVDKYNSTQDYVGRIIELVNYIEVKYKTHIDETTIDEYLHKIATSSTQKSVEHTNTQTITNLNQKSIYSSAPQYNPKDDTKQRLDDLKKYMKSYNILKDEPLVDYEGLRAMTETLPITNQLNASPPLESHDHYNPATEYNKRLMNLQSNYPNEAQL